jgi:hypothetical protein
VSGYVDRKLVRRELNTEALLLSGFTEAELLGLGDLGDIGLDRLHDLLWSKLGDALGRATVPLNLEVVPFHPRRKRKGGGKARRVRSRK